MIKLLKIILYVILGIIVLAIVAAAVTTNSQKFAKDIAYLECTPSRWQNFRLSEKEDKKLRKSIEERSIIVGRLRKDWIQSRILLDWVAELGTTENGLETTYKLSINTNNYTGYSYKGKIQRTFDRDTLLYTAEGKQHSVSEIDFRLTRTCKLIEKKVFENQRKKSAKATKAKQTI